MSFIISKRAALTLALIALCNNTISRNDSNRAQAQMLNGQEQELGLINTRQVGFEPAAEFEAEPGGHLASRFRRQVTYPQGSPFQPPAQQQQPPNPLGFLGQLGPQLSQGTQLFNPNSLIGGGQPSNLLADMLQSAQKRVLDSTQQGLQSSQQAAQSVQGGVQGAFTDITAGIQRIATNNPNLVPDVKNLYQTVSSKLNSASSSAGQAISPVPSGQQQFAQNVANQLANPQSSAA